METTTKNIIAPRQFAFHDRVQPTPPTSGTLVQLFDLLSKGEELSREEKNYIFHTTCTDKGYYKLAGWQFNFRQFMKRYLVKYNYETSAWREYWAFDKTCIRSSFYTKGDIIEIVQA